MLQGSLYMYGEGAPGPYVEPGGPEGLARLLKVSRDGTPDMDAAAAAEKTVGLGKELRFIELKIWNPLPWMGVAVCSPFGVQLL